ncbi:hypothetical protein RHMOL_Rhmol06G0289800 [Rhododendron molle]|uniref:Uncharacterized protein n=1 Tax=Rhododendron molle TaxID=49168 RepID=A0ACC0NI83_RHOML|nr:hypothetical protein RHMOL_Rhmol06G0289800 [Rhododendron molle]
MSFPVVHLVLHQGGYISEGPPKSYVGGKVVPVTIDPDMLFYFDLKSILKEFECPDVCEMYQNGPSQTMDDGLFAVTSDKTILEMFEMHKNSKVIHVYVHNPMMVHKKPSGEEECSLTKADHSGQIDDLIDLDDLVAPDGLAELDQGIIPAGPVNEDDESDKEWDRGDDSDDESGDSTDSSDDDRFSGFVDSDEDDLEDDEEVEQGVGVVVINEPTIEIMNEEGELSDKSDDVGRTCKTPPENWVNHKGKYYGKQKQMYSGVPPAGKPKKSGTGSGSGTVGKGRGRGRGTSRGRGTTIGSGTVVADKGNGRGSVAAVGRGRGKGIGTDASGNVAVAGRGRGKGIGTDASGNVAAAGRGRGRGRGGVKELGLMQVQVWQLLAEEGEEELGLLHLLEVKMWQLLKERQLTNHNRSRYTNA